MKAMLRAVVGTLLVMIASASAVKADDIEQAMHAGDWRFLLAESQKNTGTLQKDLYFEAWKAAYNRAVYDLDKPNSGNRRADGMAGMTAIQRVAAPEGLNMTKDFESFAELQRDTPAHLLSAKNQENVGLWRLTNQVRWKLIQNGSDIRGEVQLLGADGKPVAIKQPDIEGKVVADAQGRVTYEIEIIIAKGLVQKGTFAFEGSDTRVLVGEIRTESTNPNFPKQRPQQIRVTRAHYR